AVTPQRYDELSLCSDDLDDWYSLVLNPFQTLTIVVEYEPAEANLLVEAIDPMLGFPLGIPIDERPGRREIQVFSLFGGPNLIHIVNNTPELNVSYTMSLTAQ
ncbi:MAG: hypothetical protein AAFS10_10065, partial [Myxococcota bacterium]